MSLSRRRRSLKVSPVHIGKVRQAFNHRYLNQALAADDWGVRQSTVSKFLTGSGVDWRNFLDFCEKLDLDWKEIRYVENAENELDPGSEENTGELRPTKQPLLSPPVPSAGSALEYPEGQVKLNSRFYVERPPIEDRCYEAISHPHALIRIKAPRQMGKSSLLSRILHRAAQQGDRTVSLNLQLADDADSFKNPNTFLKWFCAAITYELQLPDQLEKHWSLAPVMGAKLAFRAYFERYLLPEIGKPLTLGLDEVDRVFEAPDIYKSFFALLRALHEEGKRNDLWAKLRIILAHSTEAYIPLDLNQSPFNVGLSIELPQFTTAQVQDLANRHQLNWSLNDIQELMQWVGGHPFLVRLAMYRIAHQDVTLPVLLQSAPSDSGIYADHLRRLSTILTQQPDLATAFKEVIMANSPAQLKTNAGYKLYGLGLVKLQGDEVIPSCELYKQYFQSRY